MRPIDGDAALTALGECPYNWNDEPEEIQAVADWRSTRKMLRELPTLDVVPVDWLDKLMVDGTPEESKAAWRVLKAWKERNGRKK